MTCKMVSLFVLIMVFSGCDLARDKVVPFHCHDESDYNEVCLLIGI